MIERLRKLLLIAYDSKEGEVPLKIPFFTVITINTITGIGVKYWNMGLFNTAFSNNILINILITAAIYFFSFRISTKYFRNIINNRYRMGRIFKAATFLLVTATIIIQMIYATSTVVSLLRGTSIIESFKLNPAIAFNKTFEELALFINLFLGMIIVPMILTEEVFYGVKIPVKILIPFTLICNIVITHLFISEEIINENCLLIATSMVVAFVVLFPYLLYNRHKRKKNLNKLRLLNTED